MEQQEMAAFLKTAGKDIDAQRKQAQQHLNVQQHRSKMNASAAMFGQLGNPSTTGGGNLMKMMAMADMGGMPGMRAMGGMDGMAGMGVVGGMGTGMGGTCMGGIGGMGGMGGIGGMGTGMRSMGGMAGTVSEQFFPTRKSRLVCDSWHRRRHCCTRLVRIGRPGAVAAVRRRRMDGGMRYAPKGRAC
jgi:hypothetical protein